MDHQDSDRAVSNSRHIELLNELSVAHDEAARLGEMISVLQAMHGLDEARIKELQTEWHAASNRASELSAELSILRHDAHAREMADISCGLG